MEGADMDMTEAGLERLNKAVTGHTPGPWRRRTHLGGFWIDTPNGDAIATVGEEANAHLIEAAPALLEALEAIGRGVDGGRSSTLQAIARAAIKKTRG